MEFINGFKCYDPALIGDEKYFPEFGFEATENAHQTSFWYRSRNRLFKSLVELLEETSKEGKITRHFLEIGCGSGAVLNYLANFFKHFGFVGLEGHLSGLTRARATAPSNVELVQGNALSIPFEAEFDYVGLFDVIEHVDDDIVALRNASKAMKDGGYLIVSVPQYEFLWSVADENSGHKRRYSRKHLIDKMKSAGLRPFLVTSFFATVFPLMFTSRVYMKIKSGIFGPKQGLAVELSVPKWLDYILEKLTRIDEFFIRQGFFLPFGGTLIVVAKKDIKLVE